VCVLAARFLVAAVRAVRSRQWRPAALRVAFVAALMVVTNWDPTGYTVRERVAAAVARAFDREHAADPAGAERLFLRALSLDPASQPARSAYAGFLDRHGRQAEARAISGPPH
jgi:hypothetical protein